MDYKLEELIDLKVFQSILDRLNEIYSFPSSIIDNSGKILTATAWQEVCTKFHRANKECEAECIKSDQYILSHLHEANPVVGYRCLNGLSDYAAPIIINDQHLGNFYTGQFFLEKPNLNFFKQQAKRFGFDERNYIEAIKKVPIKTKEQVNNYLFFISGLIELIVSMAQKKLTELESEKKIQESEERFRAIFENGNTGIVMADIVNKKFLLCNMAFTQMIGYAMEDIRNIGVNDIHPVSKLPLVLEQFEQLLKKEIVVARDIPVLRKDGTIMYCDISAATIQLDGKEYMAGLFHDISERKKSADIIGASEAKYRSIVENINDALYIHDFSGIILEVNDNTCKILGYNREELIGTNFSKLYSPENQQLIIEQQNKLIQENSNVFECSFIKKDGSLIDVEVSAKLVMRDGKNLVQGIVRDISVRKNIENKLRESEERYRIVSQLTSDYIFKLDILENGEVVMNMATESYTKGTGRSVVEASSVELWKDIVHHEDSKRFFELLHIMVTKGGTSEFEGRFKKKDGNYRWVHVFSEAIREETTNRVISVIGAVSDINSRKIAEETLASERNLLRTVIDNIPDRIYAKDKECRFLLNNNSHIEVLKAKSPDEVIGKTDFDFRPEEIAKKYFEQDSKIIQTGLPLHNYEETGILPSGSEGWLLISKFPLKDKDGKTIGLVGITRDITDRKIAEDQLIKAKDKAEESDRLKTAFLQNMSHEIRTPMNAIMGFSELLKKCYNDEAKLDKYSDIIIKRCKDLLELINEILDIAKIESGQLSLYEEVLDIQALFIEIKVFFNEHSVQLGKQNIEFEINNNCIPPDLLINTDAGKIKQILINLIENAFKFTYSGKIEVGCKQLTNNELSFYVSDTGIGIPKDKQEIIFERFVQANQDTSRQFGGTGLGLSIVRGLIKLLNGKIWLESEPGKGTTFFFTIPIKVAKDASSHEKVDKNDIESNLSGTILVVEDDLGCTEYLNEVLSSNKFSILNTSSGKEAVEIALSNDIDLILMDIRVFDLNGYEATKVIKSKKPAMKIIALTAYAAKSDEHIAIDCGCDAYLSKPVDSELLLSTIKSILKT